jgi:hypothetical protein
MSPTVSSQIAAIDTDAIRRRAHERWLQRGCPTGNAEQDWLEAERELATEAQVTAGQAGDESQARARTATTVTSAAAAPAVPRPRAPRSIITRTGSAPAARLLVALVPEASASLRLAAGMASRDASPPGSGSKSGRR